MAVVFCTLFAGEISVARAAEQAVVGLLPGDQDFPAASVGSSGGFLVWEDNRIGVGKFAKGIAASPLDSNWAATGAVFKVNSLTTGLPEKPQVVQLGGSNTLFLWEVRQGAKPGIYSRVMGPDGKLSKTDLLISTPTLKATVRASARWFGYSRNSGKERTYKFKNIINNVREQAGGISVAALPDGGAMVAFHSIRRSQTNTCQLTRIVKWTGTKFTTNDVLTPLILTGDWMSDIFLQRVDAAGAKVGSEIVVNQNTDFNQRTPSLAVLPNGNIVIVWVSEVQLSADWRANFGVDLFGRIFSPAGEPVTDEFPVAAEDGLFQANPVVAGSPDGGFSVYWSQQQGGSSRDWDVYGRVFGADGTAGGSAFRVNDHTTGDQFAPRVATSGQSQFVVWTSVGQDGSREGIYARELVGGVLSSDEVRINTTTVSRQFHPAVATDGAGRAVVIWSGFAGETSFDLFADRFSLSSGQPAEVNP